jgi:hypothetical protein
MKITNNHNLPEPVYKALSKDSYSMGDAEISVTTMIDSPRINILRKKHWDELTEDVSDKVWSVLGTAVHNIFEAEESDDYILEERLHVTFKDWKVSGAIDVQKINPDGTVSIADYKCTSVWSVIYGKEEWVDQLNCYAWLVRTVKKLRVADLQIIAVLRDWKQREADNNAEYPQSPIVTIDIPIRDEEQQNRIVETLLDEHAEARLQDMLGGDIPHCTDKQRWLRGEKWAAMKKGRKRAIKLFDNEEDATKFCEDSTDKLYVEHRPGESTRCQQNYCRVAGFCDQWRSDD